MNEIQVLVINIIGLLSGVFIGSAIGYLVAQKHIKKLIEANDSLQENISEIMEAVTKKK